MNLKSKTKYISQKKFVQQQKLPIIKLNINIKKLSLINQFYSK